MRHAGATGMTEEECVPSAEALAKPEALAAVSRERCSLAGRRTGVVADWDVGMSISIFLFSFNIIIR